MRLHSLVCVGFRLYSIKDIYEGKGKSGGSTFSASFRLFYEWQDTGTSPIVYGGVRVNRTPNAVLKTQQPFHFIILSFSLLSMWFVGSQQLRTCDDRVALCAFPSTSPACCLCPPLSMLSAYSRLQIVHIACHSTPVFLSLYLHLRPWCGVVWSGRFSLHLRT